MRVLVHSGCEGMSAMAVRVLVHSGCEGMSAMAVRVLVHSGCEGMSAMAVWVLVHSSWLVPLRLAAWALWILWSICRYCDIFIWKNRVQYPSSPGPHTYPPPPPPQCVVCYMWQCDFICCHSDHLCGLHFPSTWPGKMVFKFWKSLGVWK